MSMIYARYWRFESTCPVSVDDEYGLPVSLEDFDKRAKRPGRTLYTWLSSYVSLEIILMNYGV